MNNFYLIGLSDVSKDQGLINKIIPSFTDRLQIGSQTVALGMLIVFIVLAVLWIVLEIAGYVSAKNNTPTIKKIKQEPAPAPKYEIAPANDEPSSYENDEEIVAAITAAITLMLEQEGAPAKSFRVVSFKRASNNAHWNR